MKLGEYYGADWDRYSRNWVVQLLDSEGNVLDTWYSANKRTLPATLRAFAEYHGINVTSKNSLAYRLMRGAEPAALQNKRKGNEQ